MSGPSQLKLTPFEVAPFLDQRNLSSRFVKNERQSWFSRRGTDQDWSDDVETKRRRLMGSEEELEGTPMRLNVVSTAPEGGLSRPAPSPHQKDEAEVVMDSTFRTIVIHPGSRWLRIGRASDALPTTVPNVIARRSRSFVPSAGKGKQREVPLPAPIVAAKQPDIAMDVDAAYEAPVDPAVPLDPLSIKIKSIRGDLRARMSAFKLRGQGNGNLLASGYNASAQPETTGEYNDPSEVDWTDITGNNAKEVYIGAKALRIPNPEASGYTIRRPYSAGTLDTTGYTSQQELLGDIERIWLGTLEDELGITRAELKDYSVILIIPDLYDQIYVREMTGLILGGMGFKRMCMQQESICATFGAGLSTACVIDMGAKKISISCVEEGLVLPETRIALNYGGDDVTEFLFTLLSRVNFPYREADLARTSDWTLLETLKAKMIVLSEVDVGLNLYDFYVRIPGQKTRKYMMRVYDEPILAPYSLFSPRVIDFEKKELLRKARPSLFSQEVDDLYSLGSDITTIAMKNSTKHLVGGPTTLKFKLTPKPVGPVLPTAISSTPLITTTPSSLPLPSLIPPTTPSSLPTPPSTLIIPPPAPPATKVSPLTQKSFNPALESSKISLHLALVESILATSSEELQKRLAGSILIVGGTGLIHNVGFGIDSRATPILYSRAPHLSGSFAIVPSPREIDPRMLAWKGIAVLGKLDCSENLWVRTDDWERMGLRAVKERHLFFD